MKNCFKDRSQSNVFVLQDKMALNGCNGCFLSADEDDDIVCQSKTAGSAEMIKVWNFWSIAGINCCLVIPEYVYVVHYSLILILLTCSISVVSMYFQSVWKIVWILIRLLPPKPVDLNL